MTTVKDYLESALQDAKCADNSAGTINLPDTSVGYERLCDTRCELANVIKEIKAALLLIG